MPESTVVTLPDVSLLVRTSGDPAAPVLLVLHGGHEWDHSYLLPTLDDLSDVRRVVLFDLRGCGHLVLGQLVVEQLVRQRVVVEQLLVLGQRLVQLLTVSLRVGGPQAATPLALSARDLPDLYALRRGQSLRAGRIHRFDHRRQRLGGGEKSPRAQPGDDRRSGPPVVNILERPGPGHDSSPSVFNI